MADDTRWELYWLLISELSKEDRAAVIAIIKALIAKK